MNATEIELKILLTVLTSVVIAYALFRQNEAHKQADEALKEVAKAENRAEESPDKVKPAWDLARTSLDAYFKRNLSQISSIFWLSVVVMVIGFAIIVWGVSQVIQQPSVILPASITTLAGLLTEFVGATFLLVYRSAIQQATDYSHTLERINSVGMAMQILDTLPDGASEEDLKSITKAKLAEQLLVHATRQ